MSEILKALRINCKKLFVQGLTMKEIARQTGMVYVTLRSWKRKDRWHEAREEAKRIAEKKETETAGDIRSRHYKILRNIQNLGMKRMIQTEEVKASDLIHAVEMEAKIAGTIIEKQEITANITSDQDLKAIEIAKESAERRKKNA